MSESLSRRILLAVIVLFAVPFSLCYLVFGVAVFVLPAFTAFWWPTQAIGVLGVIVLVAVLAAWVLVLGYLRAGLSGLRSRGLGWWGAAFAGGAIVLCAAASSLLPQSPEYSDLWVFRDNLQLFVLGAPLLLPLAHLAAERMLRVAL